MGQLISLGKRQSNCRLIWFCPLLHVTPMQTVHDTNPSALADIYLICTHVHHKQGNLPWPNCSLVAYSVEKAQRAPSTSNSQSPNLSASVRDTHVHHHHHHPPHSHPNTHPWHYFCISHVSRQTLNSTNQPIDLHQLCMWTALLPVMSPLCRAPVELRLGITDRGDLISKSQAGCRRVVPCKSHQ